MSNLLGFIVFIECQGMQYLCFMVIQRTPSIIQVQDQYTIVQVLKPFRLVYALRGLSSSLVPWHYKVNNFKYKH